jgi:transcriptional regulator with XRE-family HTH domain
MARQLSSTSQETNFATWLNRYLEGTDADLTSLAAKAGISQGYLSMLRHGKRSHPSRQVVEALAAVLGIPREDALKAAGLPVRPLSALRRPGLTHGWDRAILTEGGTLSGWSCQVGTGKVTLQADVQQVGEGTFQVRLKLTHSADGVEGMRGYHVRWLRDGLEQAAVSATAEGVTFTLPAGEHEFRVKRDGDEEELVLRVPISLNKAAEPPATERGAGE